MTDEITYTTRLWSEEVARANAVEGVVQKQPAYEFTGHTFYQRDGNPYLPVAP